MQGFARVELMGTITQEPELRYTPAGLALLELNLAGDDRVLGDDGVERMLPWYHRATVFGAFAETLANGLEVGDGVHLHGRLEYQQWKTEGGQNRSAVKVIGELLRTFAVSEDRVTRDSRGQPRLLNAVNTVSMAGNLTRDAELRYTPSGAAVTHFGVAVNEKYKVKGEERERVGYFNGQVWRELAEAVGEFRRGQAVIVRGRLANNNWTDQDGNKRYEQQVEATHVESVTFGRESRTTAPRQDTSHLDIDEEFPDEEGLPF